MINLNSSVYRLRLDLHESTAQDCVTLNKGETNRRIEIELYENNAPWEFDGSVTAAICISGEEDIFPVDIEGNKVVYEPLGELTGTVGIREVQVRVMESDNTSVDPDEPNTDKLLYTPRFTAIINDVVNDGTETAEQARQGDLIAQINGVIDKADEGGFDGYSPTVTVEPEILSDTTGWRVTITDKNGEHEFDILNGVKGDTGEQGEPGADGQDGADGAPGTDGEDGYSPTVTVTAITGGHRVTITDADGPHTFDVLDGQGGGGGSDVPVFVIPWYSNPTEEQKTNIVGTFAQMTAVADKKYFLYLYYNGKYIVAESIQGSSAVFVNHDSNLTFSPIKYTLSAESVQQYSQKEEYLVEDTTFDPNGEIPATQEVIADYVEGKLDDLSIPTKTSDLTNDSGFITSGDVANKADKPSIVTSGTTFEAADNTEYRFGEVASLTMTFPESIPDRFDIFVAFTSGTTATAFTFPTGIVWSGDDITDGEFVPAASKRYNIALWYDGSAVNGIVRGVV